VKNVILVAALAAIVLSSPISAQEAPSVDLVLKPADQMMIKDYLTKGAIHVTQPDGTTHTFVDATMLYNFLVQQEIVAQENAKKAAAENSGLPSGTMPAPERPTARNFSPHPAMPPITTPPPSPPAAAQPAPPIEPTPAPAPAK
jgi:hypothetical protein